MSNRINSEDIIQLSIDHSKYRDRKGRYSAYIEERREKQRMQKYFSGIFSVGKSDKSARRGKLGKV